MTAERTPILFVHHRPELGGAPTSLVYLIERLDRSRFEPHVFCPWGPVAELFEGAGAIVHRGRVAGFTHIWASTYAGRRWALLGRELLRLPGHVKDFRATLDAAPFALVHLNDSPLVAAAWLARRAGIPVVWHLRSALPEHEGPRRSRLLRAAIKRLSSETISINRDVGRSFGVAGTVVANPVDLNRFAPADVATAKARLGLDPERPVVAFFGFLYASKGYREFLQAAGLTRRRGIEATYLVVGGAVRSAAYFKTSAGRTLERLGIAQDFESDARLLVSRLGLEDSVQFLPFTTETARLYQASDVVVAPSRGPELARPILEASACGCAVIASGSLSGAGLLLPGETGFIVPRRSPDALAATLERLLSDSDLRSRIGRAARAHAEELFDAEKSAARTFAVYERLLAA
jgi:glycosyltransferase involved in cell wall biosynthesis